MQHHPIFALCGALAVALTTLTALSTAGAAHAQAFVHPGILHTRADLDRMKQNVAQGVEPWKSGYEVFQKNPESLSTYTMLGPFPEVDRNPTHHQRDYDSDANAAYQNAINWYITGDVAYANKSKSILNAWASTLKKIGGADAVLMAGLGPFKMVNAAEIIRYTNAGWSDADIAQCTDMFRNVVYPVIKDFALFANGNWDTAAIKTMLAIAVFCDDHAMYERALCYYVNGAGDGRLTYYIYENGECQESGRDQGHTQLGLGHLGDCCEIAWNQGLDLYAYADNRLLKGFEYTAKYNLGEDVPYVPDLDRTGKYAHKVISPRGPFRPLYEQIYNHYVRRAKIAASYTQKAAERIRPEGSTQGADHPGYGTLLYSLPDNPASDRAPGPPAAPGALVATASTDFVALNWVASVGAVAYSVKRADAVGGPYVTVAKSVRINGYIDKPIRPGTLYHYVVSAVSELGEGPDSSETSISSGLPSPWSHQDIGNPGVAGTTDFDGNVFTLEGAGKGGDGATDALQFAYQNLDGDGVITARFVPQVSSQFTNLGLMTREDLTANAAQASLLIVPRRAGAIEVPGWRAQLSTRSASGADVSDVGPGIEIPAPYVTYGRLMEPYYLRLTRAGDTVTGEISADAQNWTTVGTATIPLKKTLFVGLAANSGLGTITTTVQFDHVAITNK